MIQFGEMNYCIKLILNGLSLKFILFINSMYTELQAAVKLPNCVTPYFSSLVGVRQAVT